jgi:stearoyl-CoA desaturase (delta-9 desaturase)
MQRSPDLDRPSWLASIPFLAAHLVALATPVLAPFEWRWLALAAVVYAVRMFAVTAGYHRYFSHRAYRTSRAFQLLLAVVGASAGQKGPLWWAAHHRDHHRFSDGPEDVHSPLVRGFWWSHVGWILARRYDGTRLERVKDLACYPELRFVDRAPHLFPVALAAGLFAAGGLPALLWGFFVSTVALWHATFTINSVAHVIGRRRYETGDGSRNSLALALLTLGEGWHNNHHFWPSAANQGFFWFEVDVTYAVLRVLAALRIVRDLRRPPAQIRYAHLAQASRPAPERSRAPVADAGMATLRLSGGRAAGPASFLAREPPDR